MEVYQAREKYDCDTNKYILNYGTFINSVHYINSFTAIGLIFCKPK